MRHWLEWDVMRLFHLFLNSSLNLLLLDVSFIIANSNFVNINIFWRLFFKLNSLWGLHFLGCKGLNINNLLLSRAQPCNRRFKSLDDAFNHNLFIRPLYKANCTAIMLLNLALNVSHLVETLLFPIYHDWLISNFLKLLELRTSLDCLELCLLVILWLVKSYMV